MWGGFTVAFHDTKNLTNTCGQTGNIPDKHSSAAPVRAARGERGVLRLNTAPRSKRTVLQQVFFLVDLERFFFHFPAELIAFKLPG